MKDKNIRKLKDEIENKREKLNNIVNQGIDKDKILKFSQELDLLINEYTFASMPKIKNGR